MSEFKSASFSAEDGSNGTDFVGVTTFTSPYYFVPPSGTTAQRPSGEGLTPGMLRFNTDIGRLEVWRGDHWGIILGDSPNIGISTNAAGTSGGLGTRGLFMGGYITPAPNDNANIIDVITISSLGNATKFGEILTARGQSSSCSSSTRGLYAMGRAYPAASTNQIEYVTISSQGNSINFGQTSTASTGKGSLSNSTRGLFTVGGIVNTIEYVTIASTGDTVNFGQLSVSRSGERGLSSSTRGIFSFALSSPSPQTLTNVIDYVTISTTGNAVNFGNAAVESNVNLGACSNSTRGLFMGGSSDRKSTRLNSSHVSESRMPSSA